MSRLVRAGLVITMVAALSGCYTIKHNVVVNEDLTIDQRLYMAVDMTEFEMSTDSTSAFSSSSHSAVPETDFDTWWTATFDDDEEFDSDPFMDDPAVPADTDDPNGEFGDVSVAVGHDTTTIDQMQSYFGTRMTYQEINEPPLTGFDITITGMTVAEANEFALSPDFVGMTYAVTEDGGQVGLVVTLPESSGGSPLDPAMIAQALDWEQTFEMPGPITEHTHGTVSETNPNVVSVSYEEASSTTTMSFTSSTGGDQWWSFAQPVLDAIEDTIGYTMLAIIFGALLVLFLIIKLLRNRGGGRSAGPAPAQAYAPNTPQLTPGYAPGTTFMPQGAQPQQGYPPQQGQPPQQGYPPQQGQPPQQGYPPQQGQPPQQGYPPR